MSQTWVTTPHFLFLVVDHVKFRARFAGWLQESFESNPRPFILKYPSKTTEI